jgi:Integrase core domain
LNQRPLGYEGKGGCDGGQIHTIGSIRDRELSCARLGRVGAGRRGFTDRTRTVRWCRPLDSPVLRRRVKGLRIEEVLTAPHSPWQNPFAERLIGSIQRECLNHVLVLGERHLRRVLVRYFAYYHRARPHLSLNKDAPDRRSIEPPELGRVIQIPEVGGLHHRYVRRAA